MSSHILRKKLCAAAVAAVAAAAVVGGVVNKNETAYAYSEVNGEKSYSIAADKIIYRTEAPFDKTINTFEAWIQLPAELADQIEGGVILGNYFNLPTGYPGGVNFGVGKGGKFELYWNFGVGPTNRGDKYNVQLHKRFESVDLRNGEWTHVAIVRDPQADTLAYYVNGELEESVDVRLSDSVCDMVFGIGSDWNNWYNDKTPFMGKIRQVTVYSHAVSAQTIAADMACEQIRGADRDGLGLMANWYFTEKWGVDKVVSDSSGNGADCSRATIDCYVEPEFADDFDYSFVAIPDMQAMTYWKPYNFMQQSEWIVDNADKLKIKFAMYLGDMTESRYEREPEKSEDEWKIAEQCMTVLDGKVPYSFVLGNHDYDNWTATSRSTTMFGKYFPYSKYSTLDTFGGAFQAGDMANTYRFFKCGKVEYLVFALEFGPRTTVLNWANRIIDEHPNSRVIVTSHSFVGPNGSFVGNGDKFAPGITYDSCNNGQQTWERLLKRHDNVFMSFSGHICTDDVVMRSDIGDNGNTVRSVLIDAQGSMMTSAMNTLLVVQVNERTKTMHFCYYSPEFDMCYNEQSQYAFSFADPNNPTVGVATAQAPEPTSNAGAATAACVGGASAVCAAAAVIKKRRVL